MTSRNALRQLDRALRMAAILAMTCAAAARADCPTNQLRCATTVSTTEAKRTVSCFGANQGGSAGYDLVAGTFSAQAYGYLDVGSSSSLSASDHYTLTGLPAGNPFTIVARLTVSARSPGGCGDSYTIPSGAASAILRFDADARAATVTDGDPTCSPTNPDNCCQPGGALDTTLAIDVAGTAGQPFDLKVSLNVNAAHGTSNVSAVLRFEELPPGTQITSCQGYVQDAPVAAVRTRWSRVKQLYR